jgi:hypothetical protein
MSQQPPAGKPDTQLEDAELRAVVRAALRASESAEAPSFTTLWQRAASTPASSSATPAPRWSYVVAAGTAAVAVGVVLAWQQFARDPARPADPAALAADLTLALELAAREPLRTPTDALLDTAPASMIRGAPALPAARYPLVPEEKYL